MTPYQSDLLLDLYLGHLAYGHPNRVLPSQVEHDKRKQKKAVREMVEGGHLTPCEGGHAVTSKLYDELAPETLDLFAEWQTSRLVWNRSKEYALVRFDSLTRGQKKTALTCAGHLEWRLCYETPLRYQHAMESGDLSGPVGDPDSRLGEKVFVLRKQMAAQFQSEKRGGRFPDFELVLSKPALTEHVKKTLADETFERTFRANLRWGLVELGLASKEEAELVVTADEPDWAFGAACNLGSDPQKWGEKFSERLMGAREAVTRMQTRLASLETLAARVEERGGWDVLVEVYRTRLREEMAKKAQE